MRFATSRYKYNAAYWIHLDALTPGTLANIDAKFVAINRLEITTSELSAFTLNLAGHPKSNSKQSVEVTIDGKKIMSKVADALSFSKREGEWSAVKYEATANSKRPGAEGPISEAIASRHVYVYGTADNPYWALNLGFPETVQASSTEFNGETYPLASVVRYHFAARGKMPAVDLTWYDGGLMPKRPDELEEGRLMGDNDGGVLYVGTKGKLMHGCYGKSPRLVPETKMKAFKFPPKTLPRSPGIMEEWVAAIKSGNGAQTCSNFDYAAKLTETMLLGNVAIRMAAKNTILQYDAEKMSFPNMPEADEYLAKTYRPGWSL